MKITITEGEKELTELDKKLIAKAEAKRERILARNRRIHSK